MGGEKTVGKSKTLKTGGTVESKHREQLELFEQNKYEIPSQKKELNVLKKQLTNPDLNDIDRRELTEKVQKLEKKIHNIENNVDEYEYLLNVGPLLFKYFDSFNSATDLSIGKNNFGTFDINTNESQIDEDEDEVDDEDDSEDEIAVTPKKLKTGKFTSKPITENVNRIRPNISRPNFKRPNVSRSILNSGINKNSNSLLKNSSGRPLKIRIGARKNIPEPITATASFSIRFNKNAGGAVNRAELLDEFKSMTNPNYVRSTCSKKIKNEAICDNCNVLRHLNSRESVYICPGCGIEEITLLDSERQSYKDPPPEVNYFAYKRINHFNELLAQFQAKESTNIPKEVIDTITVELRKERKSVKDLDPDTVKRYLKKHSDKRYNQYYDHIFHIIHLMNGMKPLSMTPEMEERLRSLFLQIQEPFEKYRPVDRKNFISYYFVFYKFCELLGYKEYLPYFPLLKSKEKLYEQEKIWEKICSELGWPTSSNINVK